MGTTIELSARDGHTLSAYRVTSAQAKKGLVVAQEIFGVNEHIRHVCDAFAEQGYDVIAPALFDRAERGVELGYAPEDVARGVDLRAWVPEAGTVCDIEAAAAALGDKAVGLVGYCWGGTVAWWGATRSRRFSAAVGWYGGSIAAYRRAKPNCPVQLHFGELDASIPLVDVHVIREAHPGVESFLYPGVGHAFGTVGRANYDAEATALAQERTLAFFSKHL